MSPLSETDMSILVNVTDISYCLPLMSCADATVLLWLLPSDVPTVTVSAACWGTKITR